MRLMVEALKFACEKKNIYPHIGVSVFRIWVIIIAFVGIQFAWNLRPFLCNKSEEFKLFRKYEGNFYTAIIYSVQQLVSGDNAQQSDVMEPPSRGTETTGEETNDTIDILDLLK